METTSPGLSNASQSSPGSNVGQASPFSQEWVSIPKEEQINLTHQAHYWKAQHAQLKQKITALEEDIKYRDAKIKDLQNRLFGKKSEKQGLTKSIKGVEAL